MDQLKTHTDEALLELLGRDSSQAMELIFRQYFGDMVNAVYPVLRDRARSEDMVQDVFLKFWKQREELQINISLKAYLRRSCVNGALDVLRKSKRFQTVEAEPVLRQSFVSDASAIQVLEGEELQRAIHLAIDGLNPKCRTVFLLSRKEELTNQEIADRLDVSIKTVEAHMTIALKKLRTALKKYQ